MSKYRCPKCGQNESFHVNNFVEIYTAEVDAHGDFLDHVSFDQSYVDEHSDMTCPVCGHTGSQIEFEEEA